MTSPRQGPYRQTWREPEYSNFRRFWSVAVFGMGVIEIFTVIIGLAVQFAVVYLAVRLALRHDRQRR